MKLLKTHIIIIVFLILQQGIAQTAFYNEGNIRMHTNAKVGFHTNLINDGKFDDKNKGEVGFYSNNEVLTVSGTNRAIFYNVDVVTFNSNLELKTSLGVTNDLNFIEGKIITPREDTNVSLDFIRHQFYGGENDSRYIDGYASVIGNNTFSFPIGHDDRLRPMILPEHSVQNFFKGAYFFENPNTPSTFGTSFETSKKDGDIQAISNQEFWDLNGTTETNITLTWDGQSNIVALASSLNDLRVVGWNKAENIWEDLGNTNISGNFEKGEITSKPFIPNTYEVITIGSVSKNGIATTKNYLISPDKDNVNESLIIDGLENYKYNVLSIYNRWGILVYRMNNYKNEFRGQSEGRATIFVDEGLPEGTYFYMVEFGNTTQYGKQEKGWVYIKP